MVRNTLNIVKELIDAFLGFRKNDIPVLLKE